VTSLDLSGDTARAHVRGRDGTVRVVTCATFRAIVCTCPDPARHRQRLEGRKRGIPGWHEGGSWENVQRRLAAFPPWDGDVLTVDGTRPLDACLADVLRYLEK
jgi:hypothetical protein